MYKNKKQQQEQSHNWYIKHRDLVNKNSRERYLRLRKPCPICGKLIGKNSTKCGQCKLKERNPSIFIQRKGKIKKCLVCNIEIYCIQSQLNRKKFCSRKCAYKGKSGKPKKGFYKICICGRNFYISQSMKLKKYCSKKCFYQSIKKEDNKICLICKKTYYRTPSQIKFRGTRCCSKKCYGISMKSKNNREWKGGTSYKKFLWRVFSKYIRQRDGGICITCGKKDDWKKMDAGHYIPRTAGLSIYFEEKNVHCQCTTCNRWKHGDLTKYALRLREKYGENILDELDQQRRKIIKISIPEYQEKINFYKKKLEDEFNGF